MQVVVLGGGVVGITTAYYLARAGHSVTVVERQPGPAMETSYANAGEISPGYASPWAAPDVPMKALKWLFMQHAPLILKPKLDLEMIGWLLATLQNCTSRRYIVNKRRMVRLAEYSRDQLELLRGLTGIAYDQRTQGTLQLFRTQPQLDGAAKDIEVLQKDGVPFELLDRKGCIDAEPGLTHSREAIAGGLRLPRDETGDCYKFTVSLAHHALNLGVKFRFCETVQTVEADARGVTGVRTDRGLIRAETYVLALGSYSPPMVRKLGVRLPVYPVKGYSITVPISDKARAPVSTLLDETFKVAITRLGDRIRVGGMAEVSGFDSSLPPRRRDTLEHSLEGLFPKAGRLEDATYWSGLRPMTPDGTPIVGPSGVPNLFVNTGHGTLGWTMACGSGKLISDLVSGMTPEIQADDLSVQRYAA